ncbi:T9SS type B sorting domain-containing protein [Aestuariibaculum suncheonense]|uniref:T9SS type B sorting domain-containing protein n=1 Tax=Aestuariibaculum suncheonense TaxID=1028745 RepID=A0A8J6Q7A5_9FLAO|nr:T9SS type B sorting domain-containing protein [Aestuariibaculum suncheonense]MBD0834910.1 T9SS type B sorting domain-containing protein [Aestuariibaculum suncheonense]
MIKKIATLLFIFNSLLSFSQSEASNWFFGDNAGIRFNPDGTITEQTNSKLSTTEGCATISDANGNLLFYTDGVTVWNKNHMPMPNGYGLFGDASSTQSAIVVPQPENPNIYYIFTLDTAVSRNDPDYGFNYSVVDMNLDSGLGNVTTKNSRLLSFCSEKVTAVVKDCVSQSIWVITFAPDRTQFIDTFFAYEVSTSGLNTTPVKSSFNTNIQDKRGYLKLSPDGTKLICANGSFGLFLYDFDKTTGIVSNETPININFSRNGSKPQVSYGAEFSPNNELLYISSYYETTEDEGFNPIYQYGALLQYDLTAANISGSEMVLDHRQTYRGALQLGPNGKIYRSMNRSYNQGLPYLSVINNPNLKGTACNYAHSALKLSRDGRQGLPPFITSFFSQKIDIIGYEDTFSIELQLCENDTYTLKAPEIPGATYVWSYNRKEISNTDYFLEVDKSGVYSVFIDPNTGECDKTFEGVANVFYNANPVAYDYTLTQCDEDGIAGGITRFNLKEAKSNLSGNIEGLDVEFYEDETLTTLIPNPENYSFNADAPQPLYAKVYHINSGCFDVSTLNLNVNLTQIDDFSAPPLCDELNSEDGLNTFNLDDITSSIQTTNNISASVITYYPNYDDALLEQNPLSSDYKNTTPYNQTIYSRIENDNSCFGINKVFLTVNKLPEIETESHALYCLNNFPQTISINAGMINDNPENYTYTWSTGETTHDININQPGIYTVSISNSVGCSKERTVTVETSNIATIDNISVKDASVNNTITAVVSGEGYYEFALYDENLVLVKDYQESNVFTNVRPGIYNLYIKDVKNDCGMVYQTISVIGFPKMFTPNNDGFNDIWQVYGTSDMFQPNSKIQIFDRYGKLLKELTPLNGGWDGSFNGKQLPNDDYWFFVTLQDGRIFKDHFTLKR